MLSNLNYRGTQYMIVKFFFALCCLFVVFVFCVAFDVLKLFVRPTYEGLANCLGYTLANLLEGEGWDGLQSPVTQNRIEVGVVNERMHE